MGWQRVRLMGWQRVFSSRQARAVVSDLRGPTGSEPDPKRRFEVEVYRLPHTRLSGLYVSYFFPTRREANRQVRTALGIRCLTLHRGEHR